MQAFVASRGWGQSESKGKRLERLFSRMFSACKRSLVHVETYTVDSAASSYATWQTPLDFLLNGDLPRHAEGDVPEPIGLRRIPGYTVEVHTLKQFILS